MRFFYLRDENNNPIGCLASQLNDTKDTISFAVSVCNPIDQFKKNQAKELAAGRLALGQGSQVILDSTTKGKTKQMIMEIICDKYYGSFPQRAKQAAQLWLDNHKEVNNGLS